MRRTVLITGATGTVSRALRARLAGSSVGIRAMVREPAQAASLRDEGVEAAIGDLGDPDTLPSVFEGVHDVWLLVANGPRAPEHSMNAVWAARQAGVERVVRLSAIGAAPDAPTRSGRLHALSDRELQESGMDWTILRPHWFMQNLLGEAGDIAASASFALNGGDGRLGMIDARDVAEAAARVLESGPREHSGRIYTLTGPRSLSFAEVARRLTRILDRPVEYFPVADETKRSALLGHGLPPWIAGMIVEYLRAYAAGWGDFVTDDFAAIVGRPARDIDRFLSDHAPAFS